MAAKKRTPKKAPAKRTTSGPVPYVDPSAARIPLSILSPVANRRHPANMQTIQAIAARFDVRLFEVFGVSEVARARNLVASQARDYVRQARGFVLWLDSDMTAQPQTIENHLKLSGKTGLAISGRAIMRNDETKTAASLQENDDREQQTIDLGGGDLAVLQPILAGMACLMMPAELFLAQLDASPVQRVEERPEENLICCPVIEPHDKHGHVFISEDHAYSRSLPGGVYLAELKVGGVKNWLDYGHVCERIVQHAPKPSTLSRGSYK